MISSFLKRSPLQKKIGAMTIGRSMGSLFALFVAMMLTRLLSEDLYGAYRKLWLIYGMSSPVFVSTLVSTLYYRGGVSEDKSIPIWVNFFIGIGYAILVGVLAYGGAGLWSRLFNAPELVESFRNFAGFIMLNTFAGVAEPMFVLIDRKKWYLSYSLVYNFIQSFFIIIPFYLGLSLEEVALWIMAGPALRLLYLLYVMIRHVGTPPSWPKIMDEFPNSLKYGTGIILTAFIGMSISDVDKWVVGNFFESNVIYAIYAVGARKIPFVSVLSASISSSLVVHYSKQLQDHRFEPLLKAIKKNTNYLSLLLFPLIVFLFVYADDIMVLIFQKYQESAPVFRIYLVTVVSNIFFPQTVLKGLGLSHVEARFVAVEFTVNIVLSIILVQMLGMLGPAIATLIGMLMYTFSLMFYCKHKFGIQIIRFLPTRKLWWMLFSLSLSGIIFYVLKMNFSGLLAMGISLLVLGITMLGHLKMYRSLMVSH